ncbi:MAG: fibronectin type III domain-containing protein, partial [Gammaproteobacteria bacterium]|nr:fibronectin type III domain-containing protein [Gammaproteobacteria bacterium]
MAKPSLDLSWGSMTTPRGAITQYKYEYRKKGDTDWTSRSATAPVVGLTLPNLEPGAIYQVRMQALAGSEAGAWTAIAEARANRPPTGTALHVVNGSFPVGDFVVTASPIADYFADADGDTLTFSTSSNYRGVAYSYIGIHPDVEGNPLMLWARAINPSTATITYGASDEYGGYVSKSWNLTGLANPIRSVPENSPAGTAVGDPVVGSSYAGVEVTFTYSLHGEALDFFVIDPATGQISVRINSPMDYETKSSYTGQVKWTVQGQQAVANLTINVIDLEAGKPDAPTVTRTRFSEQSNPALDVTWTAPAANGLTISWYEVQYRKQGATSWTRYTGHVIETTSLRLPNLEAGATYEFQVRAGTNEEGVGPWSDTGSGRANRPPQYVSHQGTYYFYVNNNQPVGKTWVSYNIGTFYADPDGDTLRWDASSQYPGVGNIGEYLVIDGTQRWTFEFHNPGTLELTYGVHDGFGGYIDRKFSWTGKQAETRAIPENSAAGTAVGDPVTGTPYDDGDDETDDALTYTLTGEAATSGAFVIDSASGQISVQEDANLDYETKSSYTGSVTWTVQGQTATASVTINVTDVEAGKPDVPTLTRTEFSQQSNPALDVTWTAPAANGLTITGYNAQYRKQVAEGETANAWTDHTITDTNNQQTSTLPATTTSINLPGLDAGATYEVQVRAVSSEEGEGPWSDAGEGTANRPPTAGSSPLADATAAWNESTDYDGSLNRRIASL